MVALSVKIHGRTIERVVRFEVVIELVKAHSVGAAGQLRQS